MSGSSNALLDAIANPRQVDVVGAYGNANRLAQGIWANRLAQSQQAAGEIYQRSLNPDGTQNQAAFNQGIAAGGPGVALSALDASQKGLTNATGEYDQQMKRLTYGAAGFGQILVDNNGTAPYEAVKQYYDRAVQDRHITQADEEKVMAGFGPDAAANASIGRQRMMQNITAQEALARANGTQGTVTGPNGVQMGTNQNSQTGAISSPPQPGAPQGPSPDTVFTAPPGMVLDTRPGALPNSYTPVPRSYPGAPIGGGGGDRSTQPLLGGAKTPVPGSADNAAPDMPGQTESAPGDYKPTPADPRQTYLAPPQGQPDQLAAGNKIYTEAAAAKPAQQKRLIAGESALEALKYANTGPGSSTIAQVQAFSESHGITQPKQGTLSDVDYRQILAKNLLRFAQSSGTTAGTDLGLETQLHSNANVEDMLPNANRHVLIQDLGILRRDMAQTDTMPRGAAAVDHIKNFANTMDPRAFAWDRIAPGERAAIIAQAKAQDQSVDPSGKTHPNFDKLRKSLTAALKSGYVKPDGTN